MLLRKDDPWIEDLPIPDIRDWRVLDAGGRTVGFVQSLAVDPKDRVVEAVLTGPNDRYPGTEIEIEDKIVRLKQHLVRRRPADHPTEDVGLRGFEEAYRDHFDRVFGHGRDDELAYEELTPAYTFGRAIALDAHYQRRPFRSAEEDVRAEYVSRGLTAPYDVIREAVRFGYELAQTLTRYDPGGMERERMQTVGTDDQVAYEADRTGSAMDTGEPVAEDKSTLDGA